LRSGIVLLAIEEWGYWTKKPAWPNNPSTGLLTLSVFFTGLFWDYISGGLLGSSHNKSPA
jgi:hypothetical protein